MIPENVKQRIEKEAEERIPPLLQNSQHFIGTIPVNNLESAIRQVAVENQIEGATAEYLKSQEEIKELKIELAKKTGAATIAFNSAKFHGEQLQKRDELLREVWSLWESMAECGELSIGPNFSQNYKNLKERHTNLKEKEG